MALLSPVGEARAKEMRDEGMEEDKNPPKQSQLGRKSKAMNVKTRRGR